MLTNKTGSNSGTTPKDIPSSSLAFRMTTGGAGDTSSQEMRELHLHIPLDEVVVSQTEAASPPAFHQLPQALRLPPHISPLTRPGLSPHHHIKLPPAKPSRPYRPPPPLLRLGRPAPPVPAPPSSSTMSSSTDLRDSVFCSDSGSDSSEGGEGQEENKEEKEEDKEKEEERKEEVTSGSSGHGARCKMYREKSKLKRKAGEEELRGETERNEKLRKIYSRQKYTIAKLKDYYLQKLRKREFKCARQRTQPLVTIKTEIDLEQDLHIKLETKEEIEEK